MSTFERGVSPTASMREKSLLKRRVNKEHNSNFRAGYVHVNEEHLHKTGIRGRKRYVICIITTLLAITVVVNILITVSILAVLGIGREGMESLEFIPRGRLLRFLGTTSTSNVYITEPVVGSLPDGAIEITGEEGGSVQMKVQHENGPSVSVSPDETVLQGAGGLDVFDPETGEVVFTTDPAKQNIAERLKSVQHVEAQKLMTDRVTSGQRDSLEIKSPGNAILFGADGLQMTGKQVMLSAGENIDIWSKTEDVTFGGTAGTRFSFYQGLPVKPSNESIRSDIVTYKLCLRSEESTLYSVAWDSPCHTGVVPPNQ